MRRYKSALILLVVLALMAGGYFFYTYVWLTGEGAAADETDTPAVASTSVRLVDRTTEDITGLDISHMGEAYASVKEQVMEIPVGGTKEREVTKWRLTNRDDIRTDSAKLATAASNFCTLSSSKVVSEDGADPGQFGFDGSAATVTGYFPDGEVGVEVGSKNPTNDGYYVRKAGEPAIYLVSSYTIEKILLKKEDLSDLKLFAIAEADLERVEMDRGGVPLFSTWRESEFVWQLDSPVIAPFNSTAQGQIVESIADVSAMMYEELGAEDLALYGLDEPKYALRFDLAGDGADVELLIGNEKAPDASVYAMMGGTNDVFSLSLTPFVYLDKPIKEFVDSFAYIVNINQVNHISANFDGNDVQIDISVDPDDNDNDVFVVDGDDVSKLENEDSKSLFRAFYQALIGITIYEIESDAEPPAAGEPEITFVYELKEEPFTMLVEFVPKDDRLYYVFRNGEYAGITVEKRLFDRETDGVRATYKALKDAAA